MTPPARKAERPPDPPTIPMRLPQEGGIVAKIKALLHFCGGSLVAVETCA